MAFCCCMGHDPVKYHTMGSIIKDSQSFEGVKGSLLSV